MSAFLSQKIDRTRGNDLKLHQGTFSLSIRKNDSLKKTSSNG